MDEDVMTMLIPIAAFAMVVLLVWIGHQSKRNEIQEKTALRKQLLDKFGSANELTAFLATPQGQNFLIEQGSDDGRGQSKNKQRIIGLMIAGIVCAVLGAGFLGLMYYIKAFDYPGVLVLALGVGFLVSAAVTYQLYKKWGQFQ